MMVHRLAPFLICCCIAACDMPSSKFAGAPVSEIMVDGSTFRLRRVEDQVEAIRINFEKRPHRERIMRRGERAMEQMTGCNVASIYGDVAMMTGALDCNGPVNHEHQAKFVSPPRDYLLCDAEEWLGWGAFSIRCH